LRSVAQPQQQPVTSGGHGSGVIEVESHAAVRAAGVTVQNTPANTHLPPTDLGAWCAFAGGQPLWQRRAGAPPRATASSSPGHCTAHSLPLLLRPQPLSHGRAAHHGARRRPHAGSCRACCPPPRRRRYVQQLSALPVAGFQTLQQLNCSSPNLTSDRDDAGVTRGPTHDGAALVERGWNERLLRGHTAARAHTLGSMGTCARSDSS